MRVRPAINFADSIRQTASIARWVSEAVTASNHTIFILWCKWPAPSLAPSVRGRPLPDFSLLLPELWREILAKVLRLEYLANLYFTLLEWRALEPLDRFIHGLHLPQPEAGDELLGLRERPIDHGSLLRSLESYARSFRARLQSLARDRKSTRLNSSHVEI